MFPELIFARHGETEWNLEGRFQGVRDSPLTPKGRAQALGLTALLQAEGVDAESHGFLTSPQGRSVATAELALAPLGAVAEPDTRLVEIDVGGWTGLSREEIDAGWPSPDPHEHFLERYARAPNGEGYDALFARCRAVLEGLQGPTVIFTHGVTSRVLRTIATGRGPEDLAEVPGGQGVLHVVRAGVHTTRAP